MPAVIDAGDLYKTQYKLYVTKDGALMFQSRNFLSEVHGICEWKNDAKKLLQINENKIVLDVLVKPVSHVE